MKLLEEGLFLGLLFIFNLAGALIMANPVLGILIGTMVGLPIAIIIYVKVHNLRPRRATINARRTDRRHHERTL